MKCSYSFGEGGSDYEMLNNVKNGVTYFVYDFPSLYREKRGHQWAD